MTNYAPYSRIELNTQTPLNKVWSDGNSNVWVTVYFKEAYSTNTKLYNIPVTWKMESFLNIVKAWIIMDFNIDDRNHGNNYSVSIIEMCQEIPGVNTEDAPHLISTNSLETYYNKFIATGKWPGFYFKINVNV
jgi:hypothetical protein